MLLCPYQRSLAVELYSRDHEIPSGSYLLFFQFMTAYSAIPDYFHGVIEYGKSVTFPHFFLGRLNGFIHEFNDFSATDTPKMIMMIVSVKGLIMLMTVLCVRRPYNTTVKQERNETIDGGF